jgi:hypothetical protein
MIRLLAPRCEHMRNRPSFRVLICRTEGDGCLRSWTANGVDELTRMLAEREAHESLCSTGVLAGLAPAAQPASPAL